MANSDPDVSTPDLLQQAMQGFQMYEQGRYDEARVIFQELSALDPKEGYYRTALGATCLAVDDLDESLGHFNEAIRLNDADTAALINRGEVHLRLGNIMDAVHDFARVVELDPENKDPLTERARVLAAAALQSAEEAQREGRGRGPQGVTDAWLHARRPGGEAGRVEAWESKRVSLGLRTECPPRATATASCPSTPTSSWRAWWWPSSG